MKTPEIIYLVKDREDPSEIVWRTDQPADSDDGVEYIRADLVDAAVLTSAMYSDGEKQCNCVNGRAQSTGGCPIHGCTF